MNVNVENVSALLEERGITAEDVNAVVAWGEAEGGKLVDGDKNLAKKKLNNTMVYVEYMADATVIDVYSHRVTLVNSEEA